MQLLFWKSATECILRICKRMCRIIHTFLFQDGRFPDAVRLMTGVQWLKLDKTNLTEIPEELGKLLKLVGCL